MKRVSLLLGAARAVPKLWPLRTYTTGPAATFAREAPFRPEGPSVHARCGAWGKTKSRWGTHRYNLRSKIKSW